MDEIKKHLDAYTDALINLCQAQIAFALYRDIEREADLAKATTVLSEVLKELNLSLQAAQPQWQPMSSLPKDQETVLFLVRPNDTFSEEYRDLVCISGYNSHRLDEGLTFSSCFDDMEDPTESFDFLGWMPLLTPPQQ